MVKFKVGQTVKYIGRNGLFSPLNGDVGAVLKKKYGIDCGRVERGIYD